MTIHLIAPKQQSEWSEIWVKCYNIWKKSPYKIKLWSDSEDIDNLLKEDDEEFFNIINKLPKIYKIDYVRYLILEKFGGAYLDLDIEIVNNFINLLHPNVTYISEGTSGNYLENSIMISPKEDINGTSSVFFERIKDHCKDNILLNYEKCLQDTRQVLYTVGANALSKFTLKNKKFFPNVQLDILSYEHFGSLTNSISFCRHYHIGSWTKPIN